MDTEDQQALRELLYATARKVEQQAAEIERQRAASEEFRAMTRARADDDVPYWHEGYNCAIGEIAEILKRTAPIARALGNERGE